MYTRIIIGNDIWFVVDESLEDVLVKFNNSMSTLNVNVIDGYEVSIVKEKILCFVAVSITSELNVEVKEDNTSV